MTNQKQTPLVSVILCNYHNGQFIEDAINSVLLQTLTDYEIIIIDDSSTDNLKQIVKHNSDLVRRVTQENKGVAAMRNQGLSLATGKYILFLDPNNWLQSSTLERQVNLLQNDSNLGFVICGWQTKQREKASSNTKLWHDFPQLDTKTILQWRSLLPSAILFSRHWLKKVGGLATETIFNSDFNTAASFHDCILRMLALGCQAEWLRNIGVYSSDDELNITENLPQKIIAFNRLYDRFFARIDLAPEIRRLENITRYHFLVWSAWCFHRLDNPIETFKYLQKSLQYTILSPIETINSWLDLFEENYTKYGYQFNAYSLTNTVGWQNLIETTLEQKLPRVSIVIPVDNTAKYLDEALASVFSQTYPDYEIIVIDRHSSNNSDLILTNDSNRIRHLSQKNCSIAAARNRGIYLSRGEFIAFLDTDNLLMLHKLERQVAVFDLCTQIGMVNSGFRIINRRKETLADVELWQDIPELNDEAWFFYQPVLLSAMMFRRSWLEQVAGFNCDLDLEGEIDLIIRLIDRGCQTKWLSEITVCSRFAIDSPTDTKNKTLQKVQNLEEISNNFFSQPHLANFSSRSTQQSRYQSLVWLAWLLFDSGCETEMTTYLKKSAKYTSDNWAELISNWITAFDDYARKLGKKLDVTALIESAQWQQLCLQIRRSALV